MKLPSEMKSPLKGIVYKCLEYVFWKTIGNIFGTLKINNLIHFLYIFDQKKHCQASLLTLNFY